MNSSLFVSLLIFSLRTALYPHHTELPCPRNTQSFQINKSVII